jgi:hypothetical protein
MAGYGINNLRSLGHRDRGYQSYLGHGCLVCVSVRLFCVCVVLRLGRGLATGRSLVQGLCINPKETRNLVTVRVRYKRNGYKHKNINKKHVVIDP